MKIAYYDTETGGLNEYRNPLLSIGCVVDHTEFYGVINPKFGRITDEAKQKNGWPGSFQDSEWVDEETITRAFVEWLECGGITHLYAHNAAFDRRFLGAAVERSGLDSSKLPRHECTQSMARVLIDRGQLSSTGVSLNAVSKAYGVGKQGEIHNALEDAKLCRDIHRAMLRRPTDNTPLNSATSTPRIRTSSI